ncbi:MAG TPA: PP2C family protein-serine/threonine phosphatase [Thermoanaerobaculia bacterium]|nr:PP2C family protein-serine/threonine phosphatase [Thermoanaerobaculia bacterium]
MSRTRALLTLVIGILGYFVFASLFPRYSTGALWHLTLGEEESLARARAVAAERGLDIATWPSGAGVRVNRHLDDAQILVGFRNPANDDEKVGVRLDASGRPTAVIIERDHKPSDDVSVDAARPIAERAFHAFVPNASAYSRVEEEDLGDRGVQFRWMRKDDKQDVAHSATVIVAGNAVRDIRYDKDLTEKEERRKERPVDTLDTVSDLSVIFATLFGLVLYIIGRGRGIVPQRLSLTIAGSVWLLLLIEMFAELDPQFGAIFYESNNSARWTLILGSAIIALPTGLGMMGAYPSAQRRFARQLVSLEELVLRGRITSRRVGAAILTGLAAGGWIVAVPHLIRATGLFGTYRIEDAVYDPLFRSGFLPMSIFGVVVAVMIAFALLASLAQDKLRGRLGVIVALTLATVVLSDDTAPSLAATLLAAIIVTLIFDQLFRRGDLLTLIVAAVSSSWAVAAASRLVQPAQSIQADGRSAVILGIIVAIAALAIALWGSVKPYLAWEPRPARAERERIQTEFDVARVAQERMLPKTAPELPGTSIASFCRPAKMVGGDLYDFVTMSDGTVGITVADVSGKGVPAALVMTITKGLLLAASDGRSDPLQTLADVNAGIHSLGHRSVFVTMLFGVFDPAKRTFEFVRAGHTPLLWRKASGDVETLSPKGIGVGMTSSKMFSAICERMTITTAPGDFLFLFSDGVTEAMNERSEEFGDDRLLATVRDRVRSDMSAEEARVVIVAAVDEFRGTAAAHDDMTLVVIKC